jgi:hypothetical protein
MNGSWWKTMVVFLGVALAMPRAVYAERPFLATERATLLEHGEARFDFGVEAARFSSRTTRYTLKSELTSGILPNLNFRVEAPYLFVTGMGGGTEGQVGDVILRPKLQFLKGREANPLSLAGELILKFPSCSESLVTANPKVIPACTGEADIGFLAIATKEFQPVTVHLNLGYMVVGNSPGRAVDDVVMYSLAFEYVTILPAVTVVTEVWGETSRAPSVYGDVLDVMLGVTYQLNRRVAFDTSLAMGLSSASPDYIAAVGLSYRF